MLKKNLTYYPANNLYEELPKEFPRIVAFSRNKLGVSFIPPKGGDCYDVSLAIATVGKPTIFTGSTHIILQTIKNKLTNNGFGKDYSDFVLYDSENCKGVMKPVGGNVYSANCPVNYPGSLYFYVILKSKSVDIESVMEEIYREFAVIARSIWNEMASSPVVNPNTVQCPPEKALPGDEVKVDICKISPSSVDPEKTVLKADCVGKGTFKVDYDYCKKKAPHEEQDPPPTPPSGANGLKYLGESFFKGISNFFTGSFSSEDPEKQENSLN